MQTNPLNKSKTPGIVIAEIMMMQTTFNGISFLVEGDGDSQFWKPRLNQASVSIVNCGGKPNLTGAAQITENTGISRVVGVYDKDFDDYFGTLYSQNILARTDENDLETTLLNSPALNAILHEFGDSVRIKKFIQDTGTTVVAHIQHISYEFGALRFINDIRSHGVNFDELSPYRFISSTDWTFDLQALQTEYAKLAKISYTNVQQLVQTFCPARAGWNLSQGHDCVRILAQGLKNRIGKRQITEEDLSKLLRIAYDKQMLLSSKMYASLNLIEKKCAQSIF